MAFTFASTNARHEFRCNAHAETQALRGEARATIIHVIYMMDGDLCKRIQNWKA
jgi:hypothetical protein